MLPNSKRAEDKDERARMLKNASWSKQRFGKQNQHVLLDLARLLARRLSKSLPKIMSAPGFSTSVDVHTNASNPSEEKIYISRPFKFLKNKVRFKSQKHS